MVKRVKGKGLKGGWGKKVKRVKVKWLKKGRALTVFILLYFCNATKPGYRSDRIGEESPDSKEQRTT